MRNSRAYLYLSVAMIIVGTSVVAGKVITSELPIFISSFVSLLIASLLFLPTLLKEFSLKRLKPTDLLYLSLQALLGTVLYRMLLFVGLKYIDPSYAGILSALQPAFIAILAIMLLKEKLHNKQLIGVLLAVAGLVITYSSHSVKVEIGSGLFIGTGLILLSVLGEALFSVFAKKLSTSIKPFAIAGLVTIISTIMMLPFGIYDLVTFGVPAVSLVGALSVVYYGVFLTYVSFILWFKGLESVKASVAGVFTALVPVSGLVFSSLLLGDYPNKLELIGGLLIIVSIILVVYKNEK